MTKGRRLTDAVIGLYTLFYRERRQPPAAIRLHPTDWHRLLYECDPACLGPDETRRFMTMTPLLDPSWLPGFPVVLDRAGMADAMDAGARAA